MITTSLGLVVAGALAATHLLNLERVRPLVATTIWLSALALRALTAIFIALFAVFYLRASVLFGPITHWCWHAVLPLVTTHMGLNGHELGDATTVAPSLFLAASLLSAAYGVMRATRAIRLMLKRASLGRGPQDSVIVGGREVLVAAAGLARPQVIVSAGALAALDDGELHAGLAHERGHIAHRHRFIMLVAEFCRALARYLPGTRRAMDELVLSLERDADAWALRRSDRLDLASVICKAAGAQAPPSVMALSGGSGRRRVEEILDGQPASRRRASGAALLASTLLVLVLALTALLPAASWAGVQELRSDHSVHHCRG